MTTPTEALSTEYLQDLLDLASLAPWVYKFSATKSHDGREMVEEYIHQICNNHGPIMVQADAWVNEDPDTDWELAALAPSLAEEVIQLREVVAELKAQPAAATKAPAHPEYLETLQDYEDAPVGTVLERPGAAVSGQYLIKLDTLFYQSWKAPGLSGYCIDKDLADTRRRVIYWPEENTE